MIVNNRKQLEDLADGTIITWLRIPGDRTSEAVAFVRVELEYDDGPAGPTATGAAHRVVWISPGGWDPQTIESAGVTFPVVAFTDPSHYDELSAPELLTMPDPPQFQELITGGTWPREAALQAAARVFQGDGPHADRVLGLADKFVQWLDPEWEPPHPPYLTVEDLNNITAEVRDTLSDGTLMHGTVLRVVATVAKAVIKHAGMPK